jgi:hypothetical protein
MSPPLRYEDFYLTPTRTIIDIEESQSRGVPSIGYFKVTESACRL